MRRANCIHSEERCSFGSCRKCSGRFPFKTKFLQLPNGSRLLLSVIISSQKLRPSLENQITILFVHLFCCDQKAKATLRSNTLGQAPEKVFWSTRNYKTATPVVSFADLSFCMSMLLVLDYHAKATNFCASCALQDERIQDIPLASLVQKKGKGKRRGASS